MSGSGPGPAGPSSPSKDCNTLNIRTNIASPNPAVISKLVVGEILKVTAVSSRGPIQLVTTAGEVAGAVLPSDLADLIQCISDGHEFKAKVLNISGGNCNILITHV
jgi:hypothetical protein